MARARSSAVPLALAYFLLVVYASLYPFTGWRWPPGQQLQQLMALPWPRYFPRFDIFANLCGYLPLGLLATVAAVRSGWRTGWGFAWGALVSVAMSYATEVTQNFLPERVPSLLDWTLNSVGGVVGAALAALLQASGQLVRWQTLRDRWFLPGSEGARVLLLLWPAALLFPTPVPLGVGQVGPALSQLVTSALEGTPWADQAAAWLAPSADVPALTPLSEWLAITLGLLGPCLLAHSAVRPGWRCVVAVLVGTAAGLATTSLSAVLNFGPGHSLAWMTQATVPGLATGLVLGIATSWLGRRMAAALALVALSSLVALMAQAPSDPYFAESLQGWQQGRFIHFYGLAEGVGWLWPYFAIGWLLVRLGAREAPAPAEGDRPAAR